MWLNYRTPKNKERKKKKIAICNTISTGWNYERDSIHTKRKITFRWLIRVKWITIHYGWIAYVYTLHYFTWSGCWWWCGDCTRNFSSKNEIQHIHGAETQSQTYWYRYRFYAVHNLLKCHVSNWTQMFWATDPGIIINDQILYSRPKLSSLVHIHFAGELHLSKYSPWKMHNLQFAEIKFIAFPKPIHMQQITFSYWIENSASPLIEANADGINIFNANVFRWNSFSSVCYLISFSNVYARFEALQPDLLLTL